MSFVSFSDQTNKSETTMFAAITPAVIDIIEVLAVSSSLFRMYLDASFDLGEGPIDVPLD